MSAGNSVLEDEVCIALRDAHMYPSIAEIVLLVFRNRLKKTVPLHLRAQAEREGDAHPLWPGRVAVQKAILDLGYELIVPSHPTQP